MKAELLSPSTLAFMGDAVYEQFVRERVCAVNRPSNSLHSLSVKLVNASAQAAAFKVVEPMLSEFEIDIFKRGRNMHVSNVPKNSSPSDYHAATGLEVLFGYLHLSGKSERACELFDVIWNYFSDTLNLEVLSNEKKDIIKNL